VLTYTGIGDVHYEISDLARNISIRIKPFEGVRVTVPRRSSYADAEKFVLDKLRWIERNALKMKEIESGYTRFTNTTQFQTRSHRLAIVRDDGRNIRHRIADGTIRVFIPFEKKMESAEVQQAIRNAIERAMRKEALEFLPPRLDKIATHYGFKYKTVSIKNSRSRWGSCTYDNHINLSLHLMMLPTLLIDYVIIHELCHTVHKNHGEHFWELMTKITGDARKLSREVDKYKIGIY